MKWKLFETAKLDAEEFLGHAIPAYHESAKLIAQHWREKNPTTQEEIDDFYKAEMFYIAELADLHTAQKFRRTQMSMLSNTLQYFHSDKNTSILDFGGGIGTEALSLADFGYQNVNLVDINPTSLNFANWRAKKYGLKLNMAQIAMEKAEIIYTFNCLEHINDLDEFCAKLLGTTEANVFIEKSDWGNKGDDDLPYDQHTDVTREDFEKIMCGLDFTLLKRPSVYYPYIYVKNTISIQEPMGKWLKTREKLQKV